MSMPERPAPPKQAPPKQAPPKQASAKDQVARLLTLVPYLHAHGEVRVDEAAAALGVDPDQLFRDLKVLFMCGLPGGYPDDLIDVDIDALEGPDGVRTDGVIRVSNADYLARPLRLNPTEASAVIVALRALRNGARDDTREVVDRALAKLETAAAEGSAERLAGQIDPGADADTDLALLARRLQAAADRGRHVRLSYYVPSRDEQSDRVVDPRGVVTADGHLYLDAWCHSAEAPRLFRLDRIDRAEVLEEPVETPQEEPRDLGDGIFSQSSDVTPVTILVEPEARWVTEYYPVEEIREVGQDRTEVVLLVADERWLTRLMLRLAPHATVVSPASYAQTYAAAAQRALSLYGAGAG
jgi:proteasome accessory factor C